MDPHARPSIKAARTSLVPHEVLSHPSQRLYLVSLFVVAQAWKFSVLHSLSFQVLLDAALLCFVIPIFWIPRFQWSWRTRILLVILFFLVDAVFTSPWTWSDLFNALPPVVWFRATWLDRMYAINERRVRLSDVIDPSAQMLGRHTIRILPHATAQLNPSHQAYCIDPSSKPQTIIPILFNNTEPHLLSYSVADFNTGSKRFHNITTKQLISSSQAEVDDVDWEWADRWSKNKKSKTAITGSDNLQVTQHVFSLNVRDQGVVRLERVLDGSGMDVMLAGGETLVVACPQASFSSFMDLSKKDSRNQHNFYSKDRDHVRFRDPCVGDTESIHLTVNGVPPMILNYETQAAGSVKERNSMSVSTPGYISPLASEHAIASLDKPADRDGTNGLSLAKLRNLKDYSWAATQDIPVALNITYSTPGSHVLKLKDVTDAFGNRVDFTTFRSSEAGLPSNLVDTHVSRAHLRSQISFEDCSLDTPMKKLLDEAAKLKVRVRQADDAPWGINGRFTPTVNSRPTAEPRYFNFTIDSRSDVLNAQEPGIYEILGVQGWHCPGDILVPSACAVVEQPLPTADISFTPVEDDCAGEVGLRTRFVLSGSPPFRIRYKILSNGKVYTEGIKNVQHSHDEHVFTPDDYGKFEYFYTDIADSKYDFGKVKLNSHFKQTVHPLASAKFIGARKEDLWSCEGNSVPVDVELHGIAPYSFDYEVVADGNRESYTVENVAKSSHRQSVPLPPSIAENGGRVSLSLVRIRDGRGCRRSLSVPDILIDVHRRKPTAKFYGSEDQRSATVLSGNQVSIPLRLTGVPPWDVTYTNYNASSEPRTVQIHSANGEMRVDQSGVYELMSVSDRHCIGIVHEDSSTFSVQWLPKPRLAITANSGKDSKHDIITRPPVCQGSLDTINLMLQGNGPFVVSYEVSSTLSHSPFQNTIQLLPERPTFPLSTEKAGKFTYSFTGVGDATYMEPSSEGLLGIGTFDDSGQLVGLQDSSSGGFFGSRKSASSTKDSIKIEQEVWKLPAGWIEKNGDDIYCIGDNLASQSRLDNMLLHLEGKPPFDVVLTVTDGGTQNIHTFPVFGINDHTWPIKLPFVLNSIGRQEIILQKVKDSNGCENLSPSSIGQVSKGPSKQVVQVAEIGSIAAIQPQTDHCVGDTIDFVLQGAAPWTVKYRFNGKLQTVVAHQSAFSRIAESPGTFSVVSVAHRENSCPSRPVEMTKLVHPLPRAKIEQHGYAVEDIREGEQTDIRFVFDGTPPFAFTYTRSDWRTNKVLETHTITGINAYSHSIVASVEGTYAVTFVSDRYCSFPPTGRTEGLVKQTL